MRKVFKKLSLFACGCLLAASIMGCQKEESTEASTEAVTVASTEMSTTESTEETTEARDPINQVADSEVPELEGYTLLWHDEFNGTTMNEEIWKYEPRSPGWTNNELQAYTKSTKNVFVRDGHMVLKAIKTLDEDGEDYYTSGKITTKRLKDFMYGKVVARAKVPEGQGLWPAIWMMPTEENTYGQWPKCGEIDIMEVLGHQTDVAYGTIHYGSPHAEQQGIYTLAGEKFSDDFHEFSVEWEPGEMRFYVDGNLYHTVNDWFTGEEGGEEEPYPAPFNQTFYVQLNLAVGGTWPGNPDETTDFDKAEFEIDYVRVYQKPEYDTNVTKPEKVFREPLADGNLIYNGDFAEQEALDDEVNWNFYLLEGGAGQAAIADNILTITPENEGTANHSVQLVQPELPMRQGKKYRVTFDAYAAEARDMIVCISAPTAGWIRYLEDTKVTLSTDWQTYTYEFEMTEKDDNNGRLEFNMGNQGSTAAIYLRNVRVEEIQ